MIIRSPSKAAALTLLLAVNGCAGPFFDRIGLGSTPPGLAVAEAALQGGAGQVALQVSDNILKSDPKNIPALEVRGDALTLLGQYDEATAIFQGLLARDPQSSRANIGLGRIKLSSDPAAAESLFQQVLNRDPKDLTALNNLGIAKDLLGRHAEAQQTYRRALAINADLTSAKVNMALSLAMSGQGAAAIQMLKPQATAPGATAKVKHDYAVVLAMSGFRADAERILAQDMQPDEVRQVLEGVTESKARAAGTLAPDRREVRRAAAAELDERMPPMPRITATARPGPLPEYGAAAAPVFGGAPVPVTGGAAWTQPPPTAMPAPPISRSAAIPLAAAIPQSAAIPLAAPPIPLPRPNVVRPTEPVAEAVQTPATTPASARFDPRNLTATMREREAPPALGTLTPPRPASTDLTTRDPGPPVNAPMDPGPSRVVTAPERPRVEPETPPPMVDTRAPEPAPVTGATADPPPSNTVATRVPPDDPIPEPAAPDDVVRQKIIQAHDSADPTAAALGRLTRREPTNLTVQFAALPSEASANAFWQSLVRRFPAALAQREPTMMRIERGGMVFWRVRTNGFSNTGEARTLCSRMRAGGQDCLLTPL